VEAAACAKPATGYTYARREPEKTALFQIIQQRLLTFEQEWTDQSDGRTLWVFVNASSPWISAASTMRYSVDAARPARTRPNKEGINEDATMLSRDCSSLGYRGRCSSRSIVGRN
jgi:hypothetical protein